MGDGAARAAVRLVADRQSELVLDVDLADDGLLVVNDTFLGGWRASVDGVEASIVEVNGLVRGVWLRAGAHRVVLRYLPPGLLAGAAVTLLALAALGALAWHGRRSVALARAGAPARGDVAAPHEATPHEASPAVEPGRPELPAPSR